MIPSFVVTESLPRLPSGKVDRAMLAVSPVKTDDIGVAEIPGSTSPITETEKLLAEIWRDVLDLDYVNLNDNFFEIGGDSLLSIRIVSRATKAGLRFQPELFNQPTIREQAQLIDMAAAEADDTVDPDEILEAEVSDDEKAKVLAQLKYLDQLDS
jgi:hypothetical protein